MKKQAMNALLKVDLISWAYMETPILFMFFFKLFYVRHLIKEVTDCGEIQK